MANIERVKREIAELAQRVKGVRFEEIERLVNQLELAGYTVRRRKTKESHLFNVNGRRFGVSSHNPRSKHVKAVYVVEFLEKMAELGLYEP